MRKNRLLTKKELSYLMSRLRALDTAIMRASVMTLVDQQESDHVDFYEGRRATWEHWKSSTAMDHLISFLLAGFCDLLEKHTVGGERFAQFLVSWYSFVATIAVDSLSTEESKAVWTELSVLCSEEDRSPLIHSIAKCAYTFLQRQVGSH